LLNHARTSTLEKRPLVVGLGLIATLILLVSPAVSAKTPYFTVELRPAEPVRGHTLMVLVRTWEDRDHTVPARLDSADALAGLPVLRPMDRASSDVPVRLERVSTDLFTGSVAVPVEGAWDLVAFTDRSGWGSPEVPAGYPDRIPITTRASTGSLPIELVIAALGTVDAVTVSALILWTRRTTRRRTAANHA
jgi:hypothetical protein